MKCPKCAQSSLVQAKIKDTEITVDYCKQCAGVFAETHELDMLVPDAVAVKHFKAHGLQRMVKTTHPCPKCVDTALFAGQLQGHNDEVDHCPRCKGFWFDRGELSTIIATHSGFDGKATAPSGPTRLGVEQGGPPSWFAGVADSDEEFHWVGAPQKIPFLASGVPFLIFGLIWGLIDLVILKSGKMRTDSGQQLTGMTLHFFLLIHAFPLWASILNFIRLLLVHANTHYAVTSKRLMFRTGFWGTDFRSVDFDQVSDLSVNVGPIESMFSCGTVMPFTGRDQMEHQGRNNQWAQWITATHSAFVSIENPYDVFRLIKELSVNVKTDWNYPNALRPAENPGYKTKIKRGA
jgi:Zn-finger nucleic acid-binding protein